tara:strand:- start:1028 stop:1609 length:582 start_codon:yes stop_codon:yes gene_type:complete
MIEMLTGKILNHSPTLVVLDVLGVGYGIHMSLKGSLGLIVGQQISLHTFLSVKEDSLTLFGFQDPSEKSIFLKLIGVNGIGPKLAQRILSETTPADIVNLVLREDETGLTKLKGVGKKTAGLLILHLKSKVQGLLLTDNSIPINPILLDAISALCSLGLKEPTAKKAVEKAMKKSDSAKMNLSTIITEALKFS